jgi:translation elongation factor EF-4
VVLRFKNIDIYNDLEKVLTTISDHLVPSLKERGERGEGVKINTALIFDCVYDPYKGVVAYIKVVE